MMVNGNLWNVRNLCALMGRSMRPLDEEDSGTTGGVSGSGAV